MKGTLITSFILLMAATLAAAEDKPQTTTTADSPLVRAAKSTHRSSTKKKRVLITNESLRTSKGHISTSSTIVNSVNVPEPRKPPEQIEAESKAKEAQQAAAQAKSGSQATGDQKTHEARAAAAEDPYPGDRTPPEAADKKPENPPRRP